MRPTFLQALESGPIVFDGAMGTQLYDRGVYVNKCFDGLNLSEPQRVRQVHADYVRAGATAIETNTFGANRLKLRRYGLEAEVRAINAAGVRIAREEAGDRAFVVGSIGPTGLVPGMASEEGWQEARSAFAEQAEALAGAGADALIIETMRYPHEAEMAVREARRVCGVPIVVQMSFDDGGRVADGTDALSIARMMARWGADVVGANCGEGPQVHLDVAREMVKVGLPVAIQPNAGYPRRYEGRFIYMATPEYLAEYARRFLDVGVRIVGGCCGTTPDHIAAVSAAVRKQSPRRVQVEVAGPSDGQGRADREPLPVADRSRLGSRLGKQFVASVEVDPPEGFDPGPVVERVAALRAAGVDTINIADGPRATARISNMALAQAIRAQVDVEVILHVTCRDRNLLGLQSDLLGAHSQGFVNLCVITGDPPKLGDYPHATAVYDLDSIGLIRMVKGFNRGVDPSGRPMKQPTRFVVACGSEPAAADFEREVARFREKVRSGADLVMTQPVFDPAVLDRFLAAAAALGVPVLAGILPLASHRNAEFLHNEVPGMQIPEAVRERMRKAGSGPAARAEGVAIARETLAAIRPRVAGVYLMPPFGRLEAALDVLA